MVSHHWYWRWLYGRNMWKKEMLVWRVGDMCGKVLHQNTLTRLASDLINAYFIFLRKIITSDMSNGHSNTWINEVWWCFFWLVSSGHHSSIASLVTECMKWGVRKDLALLEAHEGWAIRSPNYSREAIPCITHIKSLVAPLSHIYWMWSRCWKWKWTLWKIWRTISYTGNLVYRTWS